MCMIKGMPNRHGRWGMEYLHVYAGCAKLNSKKYLLNKFWDSPA